MSAGSELAKFKERIRRLNESLWVNRWFLYFLIPVVGAVIAGIIVVVTFGRGGGNQVVTVQFPTAEHTPQATAVAATEVPDTVAGNEFWMFSRASGPSTEGWKGDIDVAAGELIHLWASVHNHTPGNSTPCLTAQFPSKIDAMGTGDVEFTVAMSLGGPQRAQDKTVLRSNEGVRLEYAQDTVRITTDLDGDGVKDGEVFVEDGERIFESCLHLGNVVGHDVIVAQVAFTLQASPLDVP